MTKRADCISIQRVSAPGLGRAVLGGSARESVGERHRVAGEKLMRMATTMNK